MIITRVSIVYVVKMCVFLMGFGGADTHFLSFFYSAQINIVQSSAVFSLHLQVEAIKLPKYFFLALP